MNGKFFVNAALSESPILSRSRNIAEGVMPRFSQSMSAADFHDDGRRILVDTVLSAKWLKYFGASMLGTRVMTLC